VRSIFSSRAPDAAQRDCCGPRSTLLCMGLFCDFLSRSCPAPPKGAMPGSGRDITPLWQPPVFKLPRQANHPKVCPVFFKKIFLLAPDPTRIYIPCVLDPDCANGMPRLDANCQLEPFLRRRLTALVGSSSYGARRRMSAISASSRVAMVALIRFVSSICFGKAMRRPSWSSTRLIIS